MTNRAIDFLNGFSGGAYPARLEAEYDLLECFARSERGETLLARRRDDGALCVVKIGQEGAYAPETLKNLHCPGVPEIYDAYEADGQSVLIRAFVPGVSARAALNNGPFSRKRALEIGVQLCDILRCLHGQNPPIIHRDVKPGNIILDGERAWLIDFGIARSYAADAEQDTTCLGTRAYAPPEQYGYAQTDPRADVYALGATLYTLLSGRTDVQNAKNTVRDFALCRILRRCTAFSPHQRYKDVGQLRTALLRAQHRLRRALTGAAAVLTALFLLIAGLRIAGVPARDLIPGAAHVADPLVRAAVCESLGKKPDDFLSRTDLRNVTGLYLYGDAPVTAETYDAVSGAWENGASGTLGTLADLPDLPNLTALWIGCEPEMDLSVLSQTPRLTELRLQRMHLPDLSVLEQLSELTVLDLSGSTVADLSPIQSCKQLNRLSMHGVPCDDYSFLVGLDDFSYVGMSGANTAAFLSYFRGKSTNHLNIGESPFSHMEWLVQVKKLTVLELYNASLTDVTGIDGLFHLTRVDLSGNPALTDLSPLLNIRTLEQLTLSRDMQQAAARTLSGATFEILYRD